MNAGCCGSLTVHVYLHNDQNLYHRRINLSKSLTPIMASSVTSEGVNEDPRTQVKVPIYWGSVLEGVSNPAAKYEEVYGCKPRIHSMANIMEPFMTSLCRRSGAFSIKSDSFDAMRTVLSKYLSMILQAVLSEEVTGVDVGQEITFEHIRKACKTVGISILGTEECFYSAELAAEIVGEGFVDAMKERENQAVNDPAIRAIAHWTVFCKALAAPAQDIQTAYTMLNMSKLVGEKRAIPVPAGASDISRLEIVSKICSKFDGKWVPLRNILSFLCKQGNVKAGKKKVIFEIDNMGDNWNTDVRHETLSSALEGGNVDVKKAKDEHTGITLLHSLAMANDGEGCRKLVEELGFENIDHSTGCGFENGDGWGEEEYNGFTPLNFACANGSYDAAKVLLRNGADATHKSGWDGGNYVPVIKPGHDYWYTSNNTPLHQAARGNHVDIIHLLLNGPDPESRVYAAAKGIDLSTTWETVDVHASMPGEDICNSKDEDERVALTPLGMALIFGSVEAAVALLQHGATLDSLGSIQGIARPHVMRTLWKHSIDFKQFIQDNLDIATGDDADVRQAFENFLDAEPDDVSAEEEEEEEDWEKDNWSVTAVPAGDARVLCSGDEEHDDGEDEAEPGFLPREQCFFIDGIKSVFQRDHPSMHMSRNLQIIFSDCCEMLLRNLMIHLVNTGVPILNAKSVVQAMPAFIPFDLVTFATEELEKGKGTDKDEVYFFSPVNSFLDIHYGGSITFESDGMIALALLLGFITQEVMEVCANSARDKHLEMLSPHDLMNMKDDGLDPIFDYCVAGTVLRRNWNVLETGLTCPFLEYVTAGGNKDDESLNPSWAVPGNDLSKNAIASEGHLMISEFRLSHHKVSSAEGKPIFSVKAFAPLLQQVEEGGRGLVFSPKAALAVQYCCEMLMTTTMIKAAITANTRSAEKYMAYCDENDREHANELSGTDLDLCAADVQAAHDVVVQNLQDICSLTYFKRQKTEEE